MFPEEKGKSRAEREAVALLFGIEETMRQLASARDSQDVKKVDEIVSEVRDEIFRLRVRSDWCDPRDACGPKYEFEILLSRGGPSARLYGILSEHSEPLEVWMEYQDWGLPWRRLSVGVNAKANLLGYAQLFRFGE